MHADPSPAPSVRGSLFTLDRRVFLLGALGLWLGSCSSTPDADDQIAQVAQEIEQRLESMAVDEAEAERFRGLVSRIQRESEGFLRQHGEFSARLLSGTRDRGADPVELRQLVLDSSRDRLAIRGRLLSLQEELKKALGEARWTQVVEGLNDPESMSRVVGRRA